VQGRYKHIAVFILTNQPHCTLYIGVTSNLLPRIAEHRDEVYEGFTKKYGLKRLVWFEPQNTMAEAIHREKSLKRWPRQWKINLIERDNPNWDDLVKQLTEWTPVQLRFS
jgi:putative endonuclease